MTDRPIPDARPAAAVPGESGDLLTVPPDDRGASGTTKPPSRRAAIMRTSIVIGVLAIVFLVILPRYINYQEVIQAFQGLSLSDVLLVALFGVIAWFATGAVFAALIPGLGWLRGTQAWVILAGVGASIPLGPWNMAVLWVVIRGWGLGVQETTGGIALYGIFDQLSRLAMGVVGAIVLVVAERNGQNVAIERESIIWLAVISGGILLISLGVLIGIVRSESLARRIGAFGARLVGWVFAKLNRSGTPDVMGSVLHFRDTLGGTIRARGAYAFLISVISKLAWAAVLIAALRVCGVPATVLPASEIIAVFSIVFIITILPISPGGAGVPELLYISMFGALTGGQDSAQISAGVMLYRVFQWFLPIPLAWLLLGISRRGKSLLPTASEFRGRGEEPVPTAARANA
jgi:putative heme transporter